MRETAQQVDELAEHLVSATGAGLPGGPPAPAPPGEPAGATPPGGPPNLKLERGGQAPPVVSPQSTDPGKVNANEAPVLSPADLTSATK